MTFLSRWQLLLLCEKSGAIALALALGLTVGRQVGWPTNEIMLNLEILKPIPE